MLMAHEFVKREPDEARLAREATADALVAEIAGRLAVLNDKRKNMPGLDIPDALLWDRARNIAAALLADGWTKVTP